LGLNVGQAEGEQSSCESEVTDAGGAAWTFAHGACSRDGALGGCSLITDPEKISTQWFYEGGIYLRPDGDGGGDGGAQAELPSCGAAVFVSP
jgi:hypothetical protein